MIRSAKKEDIKRILEISDQVFGLNYYQPDTIHLDSESQVAVVSLAENYISGFGLAKILQKKDLQAAFENQKVDNVEKMFNCDVLGLIKTLAVDRKFQRQGFGPRLFSEMEFCLRKRGAERFIVPAWKDETGIPMEKILKSFNYEAFLEIPLFWITQCDSGRYSCVSRVNACVCSAVFYKDNY